MAIGDVVSDVALVGPSAFFTIQPGSGVEWVVHNIYYNKSIELYFVEASDELLFDSTAGGGVHAKFAFHLNNTRYIKVKNIDPSLSGLIGFDGLITK